jgi:uncharacterized protein (TIGR02466 family)
MNNYKIDELFPKPVLVVDGICLDNLQMFEHVIKDIMNKSGAPSTDFQYVQSTHTTFNNLFDVRQFQPLVREIQNYSHIFLEALGYTDEEIGGMRLKQLWANTAEQGNYLFPHIHSHSIISGAYYLKAGADDKLQFYGDLTDVTYVPSNTSTLSKRFVEYDCVPGRLLIFKSNLLHGNVMKKDIDEKIVMSFNVGF